MWQYILHFCLTEWDMVVPHSDTFKQPCSFLNYHGPDHQFKPPYQVFHHRTCFLFQVDSLNYLEGFPFDLPVLYLRCIEISLAELNIALYTLASADFWSCNYEPISSPTILANEDCFLINLWILLASGVFISSSVGSPESEACIASLIEWLSAVDDFVSILLI